MQDAKSKSSLSTRLSTLLRIALATVLLGGCTWVGLGQLEQMYGAPAPQQRLVAADTESGARYRDAVVPVLESRCVSCHACYEAPCQLNLNSPAGIDRGLSKTPVYNSARLTPARPSRLFTDAFSTAAWRVDGFSPVLNERRQTLAANRDASVLYQSLALKQRNPLPDGPVLGKEFDFAIDRSNACPTDTTYADFAAANPHAGMPYGLPGLSAAELRVLTEWLETGASMANKPPLAAPLQAQREDWERFLNQDGRKAQLVARYIYEHLFLGSLYFAAADDTSAPAEIFRLVRSAKPPGQPIEVIGTRRPTSDPQVDRVFYRLQRVEAGIVSKTHLPYRLGPDRLAWLQELFFEADYEVSELPGYGEEFVNPFITFAALPERARYRFMLEDAVFIIGGFIKGPVCRGQVAVDVINDHFWVFFADPEETAGPSLQRFLDSEADNLRLPGNDGSDASLLRHWTLYSKLHKQYMLEKRDLFDDFFTGGTALDQNLIWAGDGDNPNAALTVFRHFDNAAVVQGLVGQSPKTAWVIDYPLLERIHYLLTADFDVYGNVGHQLNTRLYMDFLRIEGEHLFLTLLPPAERERLLSYWYRDARKDTLNHLNKAAPFTRHAPDIRYTTATPQTELLALLKDRVGNALTTRHSLSASGQSTAVRSALQRLEAVTGLPASIVPETTLLRVADTDGSTHLYTLLGNRAHSNITSLFFEASNRLPAEDTLTVANGVIGDYPNAFVELDAGTLSSFVAEVSRLATEDDYRELLSRYGVRRTNQAFWSHSDALHADFRRQQPVYAGWLDYSRFENR